MTTDTLDPIARMVYRYGSSVGNCKDKLAAEIDKLVMDREQAAFAAGVIKGTETVGQVMEMMRRAPRPVAGAIDDLVVESMRVATP